MTKDDDLPYRPCVGLCLLNDDGHIFMGERIDTPGAWQMPQGGIDAGEDIEIAAKRELREEIGTDKMEIIGLHPGTLFYDLPPEFRHRLKGKFRGQEQQWVYARFTGTDADIKLDADDHPEFSQWKWCKPENAMDLIVPFKRDVYTSVLANLKNIVVNAK